MSGGVPKPPRRSWTLDAPGTCLRSSERQFQPYVKQQENRCCFSICEIKLLDFSQLYSSVRKEADIKVTVLFMCIASISVGSSRPSRDSGLDNETRLRPSHLFRAAVCTFRCTSPVHFMMDNSISRRLWQICLYSNLTYSTTMVNNVADSRHPYEQLRNCLTSAGRVRDYTLSFP